MKKTIQVLLTSLFAFLAILGIAKAKYLYEYGTYQERADFALKAGIVADLSEYTGSYDQNAVLLDYLQSQDKLSIPAFYDNQNLGFNIQPIAGSTYNLAGSGISSSAVSITLQSLTLPQTGYTISDSELSNTFYITLEPGSKTKQEIVSCTTVTQNVGGTATLSGCTRGLLPIYPYTASSTMQFAHGGGSQVIFSDPPQLYNQFTAKDNNETINNVWIFNEHPVATSTLGTPTSTYQYVTKQYADNLVNQGAATSTETNSGIVELGTQVEMASSTYSGINYPLVLQTRYATSTPYMTGHYIPITEIDGKLNQGFYDLTESFALTGGLSVLNSSTTIEDLTVSANATVTKNLLVIGNTNITGTLTIGSTSTVNLLNGSNADSFHTHAFNKLLSATTTDIEITNSNAETTIFSFTLPANTLGTNNIVEIKLMTSDSNGFGLASNNFTINLKYGSTTACSETITATAAVDSTAAGTITAYLRGANATNAQECEVIGDFRTPYGGDLVPDNAYLYDIGSATEVSTGALTVAVTIQFSNANASNRIKIVSGYAKLID